MVRGIANSKIGFGDLILLLRYFFKLKVSTHPNENESYQEQNYGVCTSMEKSGEKLNIKTRILKTRLFESLNSFNNLMTTSNMD